MLKEIINVKSKKLKNNFYVRIYTMKIFISKKHTTLITVLMALFLLNPIVNGQSQNVGNNVQWLVKPQFDKVYDFKEGMALVYKGPLDEQGKTAGGKYGYVSKEGKIIEPQFDWAGDFSEGMAVVYIGPFDEQGNPAGGKCGYINKKGTYVIEPQFDDAGEFHEGMAPVKIDGKWGYINKEGKIIIKPQFDDAEGFSEGMARVKKGGKWGLVNKEGKVVIKPQFDWAEDFHEGMALVKIDGKWGYIKNPLKAQEKIKNYETAGEFIGTIHSIEGNEVIVAGKIAEKVQIFDKLCTFNGEEMIILNAHFPMMTTAKCKVISGSIKDLKPGMKVYKYSSGKEEKKRGNKK